MDPNAPITRVKEQKLTCQLISQITILTQALTNRPTKTDGLFLLKPSLQKFVGLIKDLHQTSALSGKIGKGNFKITTMSQFLHSGGELLY